MEGEYTRSLHFGSLIQADSHYSREDILNYLDVVESRQKIHLFIILF